MYSILSRACTLNLHVIMIKSRKQLFTTLFFCRKFRSLTFIQNYNFLTRLRIIGFPMNMAGGKIMFQEHKKVNFLSIMFISTVQYPNCSGHFLSNVSKCPEHPHDNIDNILVSPPPFKCNAT